MTNKVLLEVKKIVIWYFITLLLAVALLFLVSFIPNTAVITNVNTSLQEIPQYITEPMFQFDKRSSMRDGASEAIMLETCINNVEMSSFQSIMDAKDYARYWHGYLVVLRPLLMFFDIEGIYFINQLLFYILLFVLLYEVIKQKDSIYALLFILSLIPAYIFLVPLCMEFFGVFLVALISSVVLMKSDKIDYKLVFFLAGCISSYVDLLSCPLVSLIIPLTFIMLKKENELNVKQEIQMIFFSCLLWGIGYVFLWAGKWVIGSLVLHKNVIVDAIMQTKLRAGDSSLSRPMSVIGAIEPYFNFHNRLIFLSVGIECCAVIISIVRKNNNIVWKVIVQIIPLLWYFLAANHSVIHNFMTYRNVIVIMYLLFIITYEAIGSFMIKKVEL